MSRLGALYTAISGSANRSGAVEREAIGRRNHAGDSQDVKPRTVGRFFRCAARITGVPGAGWVVTSSTMSAEIVALQRTHIDDAAAVLARAFFDDPLMLFTMPEEGERALALPRLMRAALLNGLDSGMAQANEGPPEGVAIWMLPESLAQSLTLPENSPTTIGRLTEALGPESFRRMSLARDALHERQMADIGVEHWHLNIIGVDPLLQRSGLGRRLLAPTLAIADGSGKPCYLETYREENLAFYRKHGFDVVTTAELPEGGPRFWTMLRPAWASQR